MKLLNTTNMIKTKIIVLFLFVLSGNSFAQHIFPTKFSGCNTDMFSLENDTITAVIDETKFIEAFMIHYGEGVNLIRGELMLQVLVELDGSSCLLSMENKTTVSTKKLNLKSWIDNDIKWNKPAEKVSAIIKLVFTEKGIKYFRYGTGKNGWHLLK